MVRDIFGVDDLNRDTYEEVSKAVSASRRNGWYRYVLKEKANISQAIVDIRTTDVDHEYFRPVVRVDPYIMILGRRSIENLEADLDVSIGSLRSLENAISQAIFSSRQRGAVGLKVGTAYQRTLLFEDVQKQDAQNALDRALRDSQDTQEADELTVLQDYLFHRIVQSSIDLEMPVQVHTGLLEGNQGMIANANPVNLTNVFLRYQNARFDLFHGGYPYTHEWVSLSKTFANVFPDMAWTYMISPSVAKQLLHELIETVPSNKILGFGGDSVSIEGTYAHSRMARETISQVLSEKTETGYLSETESIDLANRILTSNPLGLYDVLQPPDFDLAGEDRKRKGDPNNGER